MRCQTLPYLLTTTFILASNPVMPHKDVFAPSNDVSFVLASPRQTYKAGETVVLSYKITNISNAPLYVPKESEAKCPTRPHVGVWFENEAGEHLFTGYIVGNCVPVGGAHAVIQRMTKEAVLLKPGEHLDGTYPVNTATFDFLKPGTYRFEALLSCWEREEFSAQDQTELGTMKWPFVTGNIPASIKIMLSK